VGVDETDGGVPVRRPGSRVDDDRLAADRLAHSGDPLFPLVGVLRLLVGMQQQTAADSAAGLLFLQQPQLSPAQRRVAAPPPGRPVTGQGRVIRRRPSLDQRVPGDLYPGELEQVGAAVTVAEYPPVSPGGVECAEVPGGDPALALCGWENFAHL
jgi:hypothetical protein